jgi:hypothetical protein
MLGEVFSIEFVGTAVKKLEGLCVGILKFFPYYYYLKDLSGSFIRQSPSALPFITNNTILRQAVHGDNVQKHLTTTTNTPQLTPQSISQTETKPTNSVLLPPIFFTERTIIEATEAHS